MVVGDGKLCRPLAPSSDVFKNISRNRGGRGHYFAEKPDVVLVRTANPDAT